jgi:hypothetical protein
VAAKRGYLVVRGTFSLLACVEAVKWRRGSQQEEVGTSLERFVVV